MRKTSFAFALVILCAATTSAQTELAILTGSVTDQSGAALSGAAVTAVNQATNLTASTVTNETGRYSLPSLRPGLYRVEASLPGFKKQIQSGVTLQVNQTARLDFLLTVGDVNEQVTVSAEVSLLETETSSRGAVIDQRKIVELPLNGRDYNQLALLSPGVLASTPRLNSIGFKGAFNVNGNRAFHNAFQLDGTDNTSYSNSFRGNNMQVVQPSIEALQEFKIQTNAYTAEFGRSAGALINAVIKSGTNQLHGVGYQFFRNRELDANNFFANKNGADKPFRLRNQFGGTLGGPIRKDKTFFFGDYEGLRDRVGTVRISSVPQQAWRAGRFTVPIFNPFNAADNGTEWRRPATADCNNGQGFCWMIPSNFIDPVGQRIVNVNPAPNTGRPGQEDNNFVHVPLERTRTDQWDARVDHSFSSSINVFGRYSFADTNQFRPAPRPGLSEGSFNDTFGAALWRSQAVASGLTWTLSPASVSETRVGYTRGSFFQTPPNFGSGCPEQLIGLRGAPTDESICGGIPVIDLPGGNLRRIGRTTSVPQFQTPRSLNIRSSLSNVRGSHTVKFGGEFLHVETGIRDVSSLLGRFNFSGRFANQNGSYQGGIADLLMGFPTRYQQDSNTVFHQWQKMYFFFLQDDWKVSRNFTLNAGVRYEYATPPRERDNQWANFIPAERKFVNAADGGIFQRALIEPDRNNFAPRLGFSWSPLKTTVLRGGYGIFFNHTNRQGREGLLGFNFPFIIQGDQNIAGSTRLLQQNGFMRLQTGIPAGFVDPRRVNVATLSQKAQDPFQRTTYVQQWNFGIQQELATDLLLDVAYVGNRGLKLAAFRNLNQRAVNFNAAGVPSAGAQPLAGFNILGDVQYLENLGISNYHSFQTRLEKRFSRGLSGLVSYTWGKALTNSVDHLSTSGAGNGVDVGVFREPQNGLDRRSEYGLAEFDVKHRFVASAVWLLPYGKGRSWGTSPGRAMEFLFGGWEFSPIVTAQSGLGLTIIQPQILNIGGERRSRPTRLSHGALPEGQRTAERWFDTNAFLILQTDPTRAGFFPNQAFGNSGVGILRGPGVFNVDFNLNKTFQVTERQNVQFRAEFFNAFNRANFGVPGVTAAAGFGEIINTGTESRIIQFALKYRF
ncbi:MAG: TonB-dependent receptor [Acidimicrobiia bacterium]|nr:TonB-dependent receptor [Acidimicrobiia bacterium]